MFTAGSDAIPKRKAATTRSPAPARPMRMTRRSNSSCNRWVDRAMNQHLAVPSHVETLGSAPESIIEMNKEHMHALSLEDQTAIQLKGARKRFHELRARIPML